VDIASASPDRYLVIDANGPPEAIATQIVERVVPLLGDR